MGCGPQPDSGPDQKPTVDYTLVWADEFDTDGRPDPANWTYETGFVRNQELQWYQPENAFCAGGYLIIEGRRDTLPNPQYDPDSDDWRRQREFAYFTSACLTTEGKHRWRYGRFEVRARIQTRPGLWPAIWTLGEGHEWPSGGEIDIMEYYQDQILANAAWAGPNRWQAIWDDSKTPMAHFGDPDWETRFHIWRMDWTEEAIALYLDDELLNRIPLDTTRNQRGTVKNPFRETEHYLLLNLAIGGTQGGDPGETPFPSRYEIDYVRVYQRP
ncbi:MAG: glycoside hydrolase family 16 protein [Bacteroidetes bacterium]|nr:MAG: glycoside hydrolase family 16 protein [Bacteroidota bacterium]